MSIRIAISNVLIEITMKEYSIEFTGEGNLEDATFNQLNIIGKFLGGTFVVNDSKTATIKTSKSLNNAFINTALAKGGIYNLSTLNITKITT